MNSVEKLYTVLNANRKVNIFFILFLKQWPHIISRIPVEPRHGPPAFREPRLRNAALNHKAPSQMTNGNHLRKSDICHPQKSRHYSPCELGYQVPSSKKCQTFRPRKRLPLGVTHTPLHSFNPIAQNSRDACSIAW